MPLDPKYMTFDQEKVERFRTAYDKAQDDSQETFVFEGADFFTGYAKYVLEYLDSRQKKGD